GARRPIAFAVVTLVAVVGSIILVLTGLLAQSRAPLTAGRVVLTTLSDEGGIIQEASAFTGDAPDLALTVAPGASTLQPLAFDASLPPTLTVNPLTVPDAGAAARRIDRVWQADAPLSAKVTASATGI